MHIYTAPSPTSFCGSANFGSIDGAAAFGSSDSRCYTTAVNPVASAAVEDSTVCVTDGPARIKFKRLDKTARHIMQVYLILLHLFYMKVIWSSVSDVLSFCAKRFWIKKQLKK